MARPLIAEEDETLSDKSGSSVVTIASPSAPRLKAWAGRVAPLVTVALLLLVWELWVRWAGVPQYLMPAPSAVLSLLVARLPHFLSEGSVTLLEALGGLALGGGIAVVAAALMAQFYLLERSLFPLALAIKVTPLIAIAPLLVMWLGFGLMPKVVMASLFAFFPLLVNTITGLRAVEGAPMDFFRSIGASRWQVFVYLRVPSALPYIFTGLRTSIPLCFIGAVVAEWYGADRGLGHSIQVAANNLNLEALFAAVILLAAMALLATEALALLQARLLFWVARGDDQREG